MTQAAAADRLGRKRATLASWETGQSQPDANTLFELFDIYGTSVSEAFGFSDGGKSSDIELDGDSADLLRKYSTLTTIDKGKVHGYMDSLLTTVQYKNKMNAESSEEFGA